MQLDEHLKSPLGEHTLKKKRKKEKKEEERNHQVHLLRKNPVDLVAGLESNRQSANDMQVCASTVNKSLEGRQATLSLSHISGM